MSIMVTKLRGANDMIEITRWIGARIEPFEFMDVTRALGLSVLLARRSELCHDAITRHTCLWSPATAPGFRMSGW